MAILTVPSAAELDLFAAAYSLGALKEARGLEAGTVNTSYLLELASGRFFLRIYEEQEFDGAAREAVLLGHLAAHGVPTPAPVVGWDGRATRLLAEKPAALFPWVDGDMLCQRGVTREAAETVGAALARVHEAGHPPGTTPDAGRFGPAALAARCGRVATSKDPEARALADALRGAVAAYGERRGPSGLIHGDLFRDNVLWAPGTCRIAALLDFESAHDGPFAYDIAVTIHSWAFGTDFDSDVASAIVRGYQSVRKIEEPESLYDESILAALRFTITRITDDAIRVGKRWQRFVARREAIEALGRRGFLEVLGL